MPKPSEKKGVAEILTVVASLVGFAQIGNWTFDKIADWYFQATDAEADLLHKISEAEAELQQLNEKLAELRAARQEVEAAESELQASNDNGKSRHLTALPMTIRF